MQLHPTAALLLERKRQGSNPQNRNDGKRVALSIEGGAMRGVVSAGMVAALEQLGLLDCFDVVYGCSAGAICAAYFVSGQARSGTTIFYDDINNMSFINPLRAIVGRPIVSLDFLLDDVCQNTKPLNVDKALLPGLPLHVIATSAVSAEAKDLHEFRNANELFAALKGTARIPFVAGDPIAFRDDFLLDGAVTEPIPRETIEQDKSITDIFFLMTRPKGILRGELGLLDRAIVLPHLRAIHPALEKAHLERELIYRNAVDAVHRGSSEAGVRYLSVQPSNGEKKVSSLQTNRSKLLRGAISGYRAVHEAFDLPMPFLTEVLFPI